MREDCLLCRSCLHQPPEVPQGYKSPVGKCHSRSVVYQITRVSCLKKGICTKHIGETSRSGYERIKEHMGGLRRCMEPPDDTLLKHQWVYHPGQHPDYWAKVISKHFTAFGRQVQEGVIISKMAPDNDIIMNSKGELVGSRIERKSVVLNGTKMVVVTGDVSKLEGQERKLIAELEEGGQDYVDKEFWDNVVTGGLTGGKRKASQVEDKTEVIEEKTGPELKPKRQRLITEYRKEESTQEDKVTDDLSHLEDVEAGQDQDLEVGGLRRQLQDEELMVKGQKAMKRSIKQKKFCKYIKKQLLSRYGGQEDGEGQGGGK